MLKELEKILPNEEIIYFGDTARVPYGNKSRQTVIKFSTENILFLLEKRVKLVIVACNTASALALDYTRGIFRVPVIGVVDAAVQKAVVTTRQKRIGVIGTQSTIDSGVYRKKINAMDREIKVVSRACPLFVPLVEEGLLKGAVVSEAVKMYLSPLRKGVDTLVLGCTHYPLLKKPIASFLEGVYIIDSAKEVALSAREILKKERMLSPAGGKSGSVFYVTDDKGSFTRLARLFLGREIKEPTVVHV